MPHTHKNYLSTIVSKCAGGTGNPNFLLHCAHYTTAPIHLLRLPGKYAKIHMKKMRKKNADKHQMKLESNPADPSHENSVQNLVLEAQRAKLEAFEAEERERR
jgi:hypothetical protein